jgi:hypothetical protein
MNKRTFTPLASPHIEQLINTFINEVGEPKPEEFKQAMHDMGYELGRIFSEQLDSSNKEVCVACTVEDADYLAKGFIEFIEQNRPDKALRLACFWNRKSIDPYGFTDLDIAPIIKSYKEPTDKDCVLVVVKAIISGGCVVATNITNLIENLEPTQIFIAAPLMLTTSPKNLESHFSPDITRKFTYLAFAEDTLRQEEGKGPSVYQRYGWRDEHDKNKALPNLVSVRRRALAPV